MLPLAAHCSLRWRAGFLAGLAGSALTSPWARARAPGMAAVSIQAPRPRAGVIVEVLAFGACCSARPQLRPIRVRRPGRLASRAFGPRTAAPGAHRVGARGRGRRTRPRRFPRGSGCSRRSLLRPRGSWRRTSGSACVRSGSPWSGAHTPALLDLLGVAVEAGLSLPGALAEVGRRSRPARALMGRGSRLRWRSASRLRCARRAPEGSRSPGRVGARDGDTAPHLPTHSAQARDVRLAQRRAIQETGRRRRAEDAARRGAAPGAVGDAALVSALAQRRGGAAYRLLSNGRRASGVAAVPSLGRRPTRRPTG